MLSKRIIPCLDVRDGKTTKGIRFKHNIDVGDPVSMAHFYYDEGADEIVFYDITASSDKRGIMIDVVRSVAKEIFIPFSVGGGIRTIGDMREILLAGAEKVSVNTAAVLNPAIISDAAQAFGSQCIVLGMDAKKVEATRNIPSGYEVVIHGGRTPMGIDALNWAQRAVALGAGEICLNSIDADGVQLGYEMEFTRLISSRIPVPVIASGGAGTIDHIFAVLTEGKADAALVASMVHYGTYTIKQIKEELNARGVKVRMRW
ncbi:MAG: imidazole glycerol phosphate synthase subunit HisF [Thermodesulfobacteriota bacterium]